MCETVEVEVYVGKNFFVLPTSNDLKKLHHFT